MIKKCGSFVALATIVFIALPAIAATTSKDVDITVTHTPVVGGSCSCGSGGAPNICVNTPVVSANSTVSVSWACAPSTGYIAVMNAPQTTFAGAQQYPEKFTYTLAGAASGTHTLQTPNMKVDVDEPYRAVLFQDVNANRGELASAPFTVTKSIDPPAPTASLPASLAADPFTPQHVMTVCASGCDFTDFGKAVHNAHVNNWDFVKINISAGEYESPPNEIPIGDDYPPHLWLRGLSPDGGKTRAHIFGPAVTSGSILSTSHVYPGVDGFLQEGTLTVDNLELGWWGAKAIIPNDATTWYLRNDYIHTALDGLESGNVATMSMNIYNTVIARSGGGSGPDHDVYLGGNTQWRSVNTVKNSVFETPTNGHSFKTRSYTNNFSCSMFLENQDDTYMGSQDLDIDGGETVVDKSLFFNGNGATPGWNNQQSWDAAKFGVDNEAQYSVYNWVVTNSNIVSGHPQWFWPMVVGQRFTGPKPVPAVWSGNKFVWPDPAYRDTSGTAGGDPPGSGNLNGALIRQHSGDIKDVTFDASNSFFTSWAAAGFSVAPFQEPYGWRDLLPLMPAACTDPIGLVKVPAN